MKLLEQHFNGGVLRAKDASAFLALGVSTFWRWVKEGRLPKGIRLSARATVWKREDLEHFLNQAAEGGKSMDSSSRGGVCHEQ